MITDRQHSDYERDGYLVVPGLLAAGEVDALRREAARICRGERGAIDGLLPAGDGDPDDAVIGRYLCIHFPHKVSPAMQDMLGHPPIVAVLTTLLGPNVKCMQSMLFVKSAGKPGQAWHQDENYIPTRDRSLTAAWMALDDATTRNGCLWVHPGSHRAGILWPDRKHGEARFDAAAEAFGFPYAREGGVPVEVGAGDVVFFNGYLLHRSLRNEAARGFRRALVNHYMRAESLLPWDFDGRVPPTRDNRDVVLVSGTDPYAWKGTQVATFPYLRSEQGDLAAGGRTRSDIETPGSVPSREMRDH